MATASHVNVVMLERFLKKRIITFRDKARIKELFGELSSQKQQWILAVYKERIEEIFDEGELC